MTKYFTLFCLLFSLNLTAQINSFPYYENWDNGAGSWVVTTLNGTAWELGIPSGGSTQPAFSSPNCWGTDLDSGYRAGTTTYLTSPQFLLNGMTNPVLQFHQYRYMASGLDGMRIEFSINNGVTWNTLGTFGNAGTINWYNTSSLFSTGQPGWSGNSSGWKYSAFHLSNIGAPVSLKVRFVFNSNVSFGSSQPGVFVDNFGILDTNVFQEDLQNLSLINPEIVSAAGSIQQVKINFEDVGGLPIDTIIAGYQLNGGAWTIQTYPLLSPMTGIDTLILGTITVPSSNYTLCTFAKSLYDQNPNNDSLCNNLTAYTPGVVPFSDDFDNGNFGWTTNTLGDPFTNWEIGMPAFGLTTGTHSGLNAWDINLTTGYASNAITELISPFFDFTTVTQVDLSFWQNNNSEANWDGLRLDYSIDGGNSWSMLGVYNDPNGTNWYNQTTINSSGLPAWSDISGGWIKSSYRLTGLGGNSSVQFKYIFTSDGFINRDGVSIDDFAIQLPPPLDAGVSSITSPYNSLAAGSSIPVTLNIQNYGTLSISNFPIYYSINGGTATTANFTGVIAPGTSATYTFGTNITIPANTYSFCAWTGLSGDGNLSNDTVCNTLTSVPINSIPYSTDFETGPNAFYADNSTSFGSDWQFGTPNYGGTTGAHSGFNCWDINLNTSYSINANAYLYSPYFNLSTAINPTLSFWQNRSIENDVDGCYLEYQTGNGIWNLLGTINDPSGVNWYNNFNQLTGTPQWDFTTGSWIKSSINLNFLSGSPSIQFRYVFTSDAGTAIWPGISVDDFSITIPATIDAALNSLSPSLINLQAGTTSPTIDIQVKNVGQQTFNNFSVNYSVNGVLQQTVSYPGNLAINNIALLNLPGFVVPTGPFDICAEVILPSDLNNTNDSVCMQRTGIPVFTPEYTTDFDSGTLGWYTETLGDPSTNWELGTPTYATTNSTLSPPNCWDINLNTAYQANAICHLYTPFFDLTNAITPRLSFWQNRNTEGTWDGMRIDYSVNGSPIWTTLGVVNDPIATNWYTNGSLNSSLKAGWDGLSGGWIHCEYPLDLIGPANSIQFRFVFTSDASLSVDGVSIDDFGIYVAYSEDASLESFISPSALESVGSSIPVEVVLKNKGANPISSLNIKYQHNGGSFVNYTWNGNLAFGASTNVILPNLTVAGGVNTVQAIIDWPSDLNANNDTLNLSFNSVLVTQPPFTDNFDNGNTGWNTESAGVPGTNWELGAPNYGVTNSAHSGNDCWDINLDLPYNALATSRLLSPYFDFSQSLTSNLSFWLNYESEYLQDGLRVEYTLDGTNWQTLGTQGDPLGTNWYNGQINPQSKPGWSGPSGGWIQSNYNTQILNGNSFTQLRFVFTSDISLSGAGFSMDDFSLTQTVGIDETNSLKEIQIYPNPVQDELEIRLSLVQSTNGNISIYNGEGKLVFERKDESFTIHEQKKLSVKNLSTGVYFLLINFNGEYYKTSFIKE